MNIKDRRIVMRASRCIRCLPFNLGFYKDIQLQGLTAETVYLARDYYCSKKSFWFKTPDSLEMTFRWLIIVGILRREVDGQGLTSKVRITPIGRQIIENHANLFTQKMSLIKKFITCLKYQLTPR